MIQFFSLHSCEILSWKILFFRGVRLSTVRLSKRGAIVIRDRRGAGAYCSLRGSKRWQELSRRCLLLRTLTIATDRRRTSSDSWNLKMELRTCSVFRIVQSVIPSDLIISSFLSFHFDFLYTVSVLVFRWLFEIGTFSKKFRLLRLSFWIL